MPVRVIVPPEPLLTPGDVPGSHLADDPAVAAMIAGASATIDGPKGWLGRAFGEQTLEYALRCWTGSVLLPYGPVIDIDSVSYFASDGSEVSVADDYWSVDGDYLNLSAAFGHPALAGRPYPIRVQYQVGYNGEDVANGGTGEVPPQVIAAIIEGVQQMILARGDTLGVRSIQVDDIEAISYLDADKISAIMRNASAGLLAGLWVPVL